MLAGQSVDLVCRVAGDPTPRVFWSRQNGRMPVGRINVLSDKTLRIEQVQPEDQGSYVCEAENPVGNVTAAATITVHCKSAQDRGTCWADNGRLGTCPQTWALRNDSKRRSPNLIL